MKSIILPCTPIECEKIANGDISVLVRKRVPKETPFKVYIYATKSGDRIVIKNDGVYEISKNLTGKVIGSFICNETLFYPWNAVWTDEDIKDTGMKDKEVYERFYRQDIYGLRISDLKIYDKPKELGEFSRYKEYCHTIGFNVLSLEKVTYPLTNYIYVQDLGE